MNDDAYSLALRQIVDGMKREIEGGRSAFAALPSLDRSLEDIQLLRARLVADKSETRIKTSRSKREWTLLLVGARLLIQLVGALSGQRIRSAGTGLGGLYSARALGRDHVESATEPHALLLVKIDRVATSIRELRTRVVRAENGDSVDLTLPDV